MERLEGKMDMLLRRMDELAGLQEKVTMLETAVVVLNETVASLSKEVAELKDKSNARDQQARGHSLRLYGLGLGEEEDNSAESGRALLKRVYDTIVKPVLAAARANKQLEALPSLANAVSEVYRVRVGAPKQAIPGQPVEPQLPPPLIIKFASAHVRMAFLKNKKTSLPPPTATERAAGIISTWRWRILRPPPTRSSGRCWTATRWTRSGLLTAGSGSPFLGIRTFVK